MSFFLEETVSLSMQDYVFQERAKSNGLGGYAFMHMAAVNHRCARSAN